MAGALLRPRVPMVVTVHDLVQQKRPGEHLRAGLRGGMRHLALERATRLIVPDARGRRRRRGDPARRRPSASTSSPRRPPPPSARARRSEVAAVRERHGVPEDYLLWVGDLRHPDPHRRVTALVDAPRELPLVLVGAAGQWARELPRRDRHRRGRRRRAGRPLHRRARAPAAVGGGGLRAARGRGARVRDARWSPPTARRCARCSTAARRSSRRATSPGSWPPPRRRAARARRRRAGRGRTPRAATWDVYERALAPERRAGAGAPEARAGQPVRRPQLRPRRSERPLGERSGQPRQRRRGVGAEVREVVQVDLAGALVARDVVLRDPRVGVGEPEGEADERRQRHRRRAGARSRCEPRRRPATSTNRPASQKIAPWASSRSRVKPNASS